MRIMKKRIYSIILAAVIAASAAFLTACEGESNATKDEAVTSGAISEIENTTVAPTTQSTTSVQETTKSNKKSSSSKSTDKSSSSKSNNSSSSGNTGNSSSYVTYNNNNNNVQQNNQTPQSNNNNIASSKTNSSSSKPKENSSKVQQSQKQQTGSFSSSDVVFKYKGTNISLGDNMNSVISKIGNASSVSSAPSCKGVGEDKTYTYNGFEIYTIPNGSQDMISEILITSSSITTPKGIAVGASKNDVIAKYGNNYTTSGYFYVYSSGAKSIQFYISGNTVEQIDYYYDV